MTSAAIVTVVPVSSFPAATVPLTGTELVPLVQGGESRRATAADFTTAIPDASITNAKLANMADSTIKGRAVGAGTGVPQDLTATQAGAIVTAAASRAANLIGFLNVPVLVAATRNVTATDAGKGIVQAAAAAVTLTIVADATENLGDGFVSTVACSNAGGSVAVSPAGGVTLTNLGDGTTGAKTITGVGIATLWRLGANSWGIHGSANLA